MTLIKYIMKNEKKNKLKAKGFKIVSTGYFT